MGRLKKGERNRLRKMKSQPKVKKGGIDVGLLREMRASFKSSIDELNEKLNELVQKLSLEDLITFAMNSEIGHDPNNYRESEEDNGKPAVEHLIQTRFKYGDITGLPLITNFPLFIEAVRLAKEIHALSLMLTFGPTLNEEGNLYSTDEQSQVLEEIIGELRGRHLTERNETFHHFGWELLDSLFSKFDLQLKNYLGFTISEIRTFNNAVESTMESKKKKELKLSDIKYEEAIPSVLDSNSKKRTPKDPEQLKGMTRFWANCVVYMDKGCPYKFSASEVADESGLPIETVEALISFFELRGGAETNSYEYPDPNGSIRLRPIVRLDDEFYVMPAPYLFVWSIKERLESAIDEASKSEQRHRRLKDKYEKLRGVLIETNALEFLHSALPGSVVHQSLTYVTEDGDGKHGCELDGLIFYDRHVILMEAKSGGLNNPARKGTFGRAKERIESLISDAHDQVGRAVTYILETDIPTFTCNGVKVTISKPDTLSIVPITVSLESMGGIASSYNNLLRAGLGKSKITPWAVPYYDLKIICELAESPAVLLSYIRERVRMSDQRNLKSSDEVSWFGWYLQKGLRFNDPEMDKADLVILDSGTEDIDNYFLAQMGQRTAPTKKPSLEGHPTFLELFHELDNNDTPGHSWLASRFLACNNEDRIRIGEHVDKIRQDTIRDGGRHDFSLLYEEGGLSVFSCLEKDLSRTVETVQSFSEGKKHQAKRRWWIWIVSAIDTPSIVDYAGFLIGDHQYNEVLHQAVQRLPSAKLHIPAPPEKSTDRQGLDGNI